MRYNLGLPSNQYFHPNSTRTFLVDGFSLTGLSLCMMKLRISRTDKVFEWSPKRIRIHKLHIMPNHLPIFGELSEFADQLVETEFNQSISTEQIEITSYLTDNQTVEVSNAASDLKPSIFSEFFERNFWISSVSSSSKKTNLTRMSQILIAIMAVSLAMVTNMMYYRQDTSRGQFQLGTHLLKLFCTSTETLLQPKSSVRSTEKFGGLFFNTIFCVF